MSSGIDIFTSRRDNFNKCLYWCRTKKEIESNEDISTMVAVDRNLNEIYYERNPDGIFYAKETQDYYTTNNTVGGSFMFDQTDMALETEDDVSELKINDIIVYDEEVWRVVNVSRRKKKRQNQFSRFPAYKTFITIKK